jgi:hypothetical protein
MPGLRRSAGRVARGWRGDTGDRDAELLAGFLARIATVDPDEPRVCGRLLDAGERAARRACDHAEEAEALRVEGAWSLPPHQPWDHPDWVLARAVAAAVITPEEHLLIAVTRLDEEPLRAVADQRSPGLFGHLWGSCLGRRSCGQPSTSQRWSSVAGTASCRARRVAGFRSSSTSLTGMRG